PAQAAFVGFVRFVIFGVALRLLPAAPRDDQRYAPERAGRSCRVLTVATGARFRSEASRAWSDSRLLAWIVVLGGVGQAVGIAIYFWTMWSRIRPVGSQIREARGEKF